MNRMKLVSPRKGVLQSLNGREWSENVVKKQQGLLLGS